MFQCKDCTDRKLGCHSTCESYKKTKEELEKAKTKQHGDKDYYSYKREFYDGYILHLYKKKNRRVFRRKKR